jgi:hypothetical protein
MALSEENTEAEPTADIFQQLRDALFAYQMVGRIVIIELLKGQEAH